MKTQEEIEKLATKNYRSNGSGGGQYTEGLQDGRKIGFVDGYTKCQEDNKDKKYTEKDLRKAFYYGGKSAIDEYGSFETYINSLNKQD